MKTNNDRGLRRAAQGALRAQAALELLLVLAALWTAWAALLPAATHALSMAQETAVLKQHEAALQQVASMASESLASPPGTTRTTRIEIQADSKLGYSDELLEMSFSNRTLRVKTSGRVLVQRPVLQKGAWTATAEHVQAGVVRLSLEHAS